MKSYGLLAMSGKPVHKGHIAAIQKAADECDEVRLFVSLSDRLRPGEVPIYGTDMETIWKTQLENIMPSNVKVEYVKVPVRSAYEFAEALDKSNKNAVINLYADQEDLNTNFSPDKMKKYLPRLISKNLVFWRPTERIFSGTKMRQLLASDDSENFKKMLPDGTDKDLIWDLLRSSIDKQISPVKSKNKKSKNEVLRPSLLKIIMG
jgi:hypothetical protein